jgi:N-acetylmuramoyl-L-alanine amidase
MTGLMGLLPVLACAHSVLDVRVWPEPDSTRVVFDLSGPVQYKVFDLANPDRLVIDLQGADVKTKMADVDWRKTPIKSLRYGSKQGKDLRMVFELNTPVKPKAFELKPSGGYGYRLVLDLKGMNSFHAVPKVEPKVDPIVQNLKDKLPGVLVIAIDAGHGGEDSGAIGPTGVREKDVVLAMAKKLFDSLSQEPGIRPVLIRNGDYYVGLRQRIESARQARADLFISIHADAYRQRTAHGASVFTLSSRGATSAAARWLAESENRSDLIGGVSLDDKDDILASVLLDLSQTASKEASLSLGAAVLSNLGKITHLHGAHVQQAGFAVLKSPDIPSILVETEFISNPKSEYKLRSVLYQEQVVKALHEGIVAYLRLKAHQYEDLPALRSKTKL